ncbi:OLC1v1003982C1 [Oldenlandia corymbosa var. corymbosa]|uniref:OLC1v1003982C1 n=1 Tax=Oldenlandia corymbosa var. corymbosa TaxID=529605 RepID=A0AAV1DB76_OLDCO|nr:OLC1v1003982C1 [Oldenlandia corymbosa var. corymbosa]
MSKNSWEVPQSPTKGRGDVLDNLGQTQNHNTNNYNNISSEVLSSNYFLSKDCHLLAKLLGTTTQSFPPMENDHNSASSQSSIITSNNTNYENGSMRQDNLLNNISPLFNGAFNLQGKRINDANDEYETSPPSKRTMINLNNKNDHLFSGTVTTTSGSMFYSNQQQGNGDKFKVNISSPMMNIQELDVFTFAQRFLQQ